jgi:hypothetical protein
MEQGTCNSKRSQPTFAPFRIIFAILPEGSFLTVRSAPIYPNSQAKIAFKIAKAKSSMVGIPYAVSDSTIDFAIVQQNQDYRSSYRPQCFDGVHDR